MKNKIITGVGLFIALYISVTFNSGCAQIGAPTGGVKDTLAPLLVRATPELRKLNFEGNRITLTFNEYVEVLEAQANVLVSPLQKTNPTINYSLKTVTIKLRDSLLPNTTYSIQFGNAIKDINEGNVFPNFTYVFSTGNTIDSLSLKGKVLLAETGLADSTINVLLFRNTNDTAVQKLKPDYMARLKGDGSFIFNNLRAVNFKVYALKDGDG
ncbi:MAG TPA: Ig-like domain-containing protein, partial [Ferruginibacter sp.]|nr:Ig-like domain-containing protein [Ferruginibacter sp.]